jgi:Fe2+ or Zn2+ uptake regulation protein
MNRTEQASNAELRAAGLVPTQQRVLILASLRDRDRPISAIEIHQRTHLHGTRVGLTTIYRTLHALADAGLIHVFTRDGELTYRHCRREPHQHLVCDVCGLVLERPVDAVASWFQQVRAEADFVPDPGHSDLYGTCGACFRAQRCHHRTDGTAHDQSSG